jgi:hypothetical protein
MANGLLYSTNVYLKLFLQEQYAKDKHYVWCSENFDSKTLPRYAAGAQVAPSANPADIFRELKRDIDGGDFHSAKLIAQKASFVARAHEWEKAGQISITDRDDIIYLVEKATSKEWRPLIYVIRRDAVAARLQTVPANQRAGLGNEFIIPDLERSEFDIIEI